MANQRFTSALGEDGRPVQHARPGAAVAGFPQTAASTAQSATNPIADGGLLMVFCTQDFHIAMSGTATTSDLRMEGGKLHLIPASAGDQPSILPVSSGNIHVHLAA